MVSLNVIGKVEYKKQIFSIRCIRALRSYENATSSLHSWKGTYTYRTVQEMTNESAGACGRLRDVGISFEIRWSI